VCGVSEVVGYHTGYHTAGRKFSLPTTNTKAIVSREQLDLLPISTDAGFLEEQLTGSFTNGDPNLEGGEGKEQSRTFSYTKY
jgi:hypothetical protein